MRMSSSVIPSTCIQISSCRTLSAVVIHARRNPARTEEMFHVEYHDHRTETSFCVRLSTTQQRCRDRCLRTEHHFGIISPFTTQTIGTH